RQTKYGTNLLNAKGLEGVQLFTILHKCFTESRILTNYSVFCEHFIHFYREAGESTIKFMLEKISNTFTHKFLIVLANFLVVVLTSKELGSVGRGETNLFLTDFAI